MRSSNIYLDRSRKFKKFRPSNTDQIKIIRRHYLFISSLIFLSTQELRRFLLKSMNKINFRKRLQLANKSFQTNSIANFNNINYFSINFMFISEKLLKKHCCYRLDSCFPLTLFSVRMQINCIFISIFGCSLKFLTSCEKHLNRIVKHEK